VELVCSEAELSGLWLSIVAIVLEVRAIKREAKKVNKEGGVLVQEKYNRRTKRRPRLLDEVPGETWPDAHSDSDMLRGSS
jgi:hypothetical protein